MTGVRAFGPDFARGVFRRQSWRSACSAFCLVKAMGLLRRRLFGVASGGGSPAPIDRRPRNPGPGRDNALQGVTNRQIILDQLPRTISIDAGRSQRGQKHMHGYRAGPSAAWHSRSRCRSRRDGGWSGIRTSARSFRVLPRCRRPDRTTGQTRIFVPPMGCGLVYRLAKRA